MSSDPLIPHDLPDYQPNDRPWRPVAVRKGPDGRWRCSHECGVGQWPLAGFFDWWHAYCAARAHAKYHPTTS